MQTACGRYIISYNGEVYNFKEIRTELESTGIRFRSETDSEVLLYAFAQWGENSVHRFNGMFALAIWDTVERRLFLARDRYGIKPLYYGIFNNTLLFGSEQKSILAHPLAHRALDYEALFEYFTFQNLFGDSTLMKDIRLLPAGTYASLSPDAPGRHLRQTKYWDFDFRPPEQKADEKEYVEELRRLFHQAVSRQLVSDVEISAYLSGGIDSGSIAAVASTQLPALKTFTCGFDLSSVSGLELAFDERAKAEAMSYLFNTEHYEMVLKAGDMERAMPSIARHLEEPRTGQSYPNYYAANLASKFGKVVLAGTGGDELFGGYPWRYYRAAVNADFKTYADKYYDFWQRMLTEEEITKVFSPIWAQVGHVDPKKIFRNVFADREVTGSSSQDWINHSLYFEAKTFLHGLLLVEDKLSMAHGLETRVPFLDNDLVDFAMQIPVNLKLGNLEKVIRIDENEPHKLAKYYKKTKDGKLVLRKALSSYVPDSVMEREKQGFSGPDASWFKGDSIDFVRSVIFDAHSPLYDFLDRKTVQGLVDDHLQGRVNRRLLIWSLLSVDQFLSTFLPRDACRSNSQDGTKQPTCGV